MCAGLTGTVISNALLLLRQKLDPKFESQNEAPNVPLNAATWAAHMGISSNVRYQVLNGVDMVSVFCFIPVQMCVVVTSQKKSRGAVRQQATDCIALASTRQLGTPAVHSWVAHRTAVYGAMALHSTICLSVWLPNCVAGICSTTRMFLHGDCQTHMYSANAAGCAAKYEPLIVQDLHLCAEDRQ